MSCHDRVITKAFLFLRPMRSAPLMKLMVARGSVADAREGGGFGENGFEWDRRSGGGGVL